MATPWDRAAPGYLTEWVPRFVPYHLDLVRESTLRAGDRVLIVACGPGSEVLAAARAVGESGFVRATDASSEMVSICNTKVAKAGFKNVEVGIGDAADTSGGPWDAILCAFGLWQLPDRVSVLKTWGKALKPNGKIGIVTWGPLGETDPFYVSIQSLQELEPSARTPDINTLTQRDSMGQMFEQAGLSMVRHTLVRHTMSFASNETFVTALRESCAWRKVYDEIGDARMGLVAAKICSAIGGPELPLSWDPTATIVIGANPGSEIALENRPSIRVPG